MAKLTNNAKDEQEDSLPAKIKDLISNISITTDPVVICGVSRRASLGNFEHIDIYAGVALPVSGLNLEDREHLTGVLMEAAETGFNITSSETYQRYALIKDAQRPPREEPPTVSPA